jgi:HSP20 family molecular chaperone IbpA
LEKLCPKSDSIAARVDESQRKGFCTCYQRLKNLKVTIHEIARKRSSTCKALRHSVNRNESWQISAADRFSVWWQAYQGSKNIGQCKKEERYYEGKIFKNTGPDKTLEPAITLLDEGKFIRITAELPEYSRKNRIDREDLEYHQRQCGKQYKKINLPCEVDSAKTVLDGILELVLEKADS